MHLKSQLSGLRKVDVSYQVVENFSSGINIPALFFFFLEAGGLPVKMGCSGSFSVTNCPQRQKGDRVKANHSSG